MRVVGLEGSVSVATDEDFWSGVEYFTPKELGDESGANLDASLVLRLDLLRTMCGVPIRVNSAFAREGHSENSQHYLGRAADIVIATPPRTSALYFSEFVQILRAGFTGIGFYPYWNTIGWHVDVRETLSPTMWYRDKAGTYHYGLKNMVYALNTAHERMGVEGR